MKKKIIFGVVVVFLIFLILIGNSRDNTVKIGGLFGQTGAVSFAGEVSTNSFIMALEDRGIDPNIYPIEDTQSKGVGAVTAATKLIQVDNVDVIIGPEWSESSNAISKIIDENKIVTISPWLTNEFEFLKSPYFFSATPSERGELKEMLDHMQSTGKTHLAIVGHSGSAWSEDLISILKNELKNNYPSIEIVSETTFIDGMSDYRSELTKIKTTQPDALLVMISGKTHPEIFLKQKSELSVGGTVYFPKGTLGLISKEDRIAGLSDGVFSPSQLPGKRTQEFSDKYKNRFGVTPASISGATTYDTVMLVLDAIDKGAKNSNDVLEYLKSVKDYKGYSGNISFNELGMITSGETELHEVKGESFVVVK